MLRTEYVDNFSEFFEAMSVFFEDHYSNCEEVRAKEQQLNINIDVFQEAIDRGLVNFFILKDNEKPVGYINVSINHNPLFDKPQAIVDYLYIFPEERKKGYTKEALSEIEKELISEGLDELNIMLPNKDYSEDVAFSLGYAKTSSTYYKKLGD